MGYGFAAMTTCDFNCGNNYYAALLCRTANFSKKKKSINFLSPFINEFTHFSDVVAKY
jgi:hypothetical protein